MSVVRKRVARGGTVGSLALAAKVIDVHGSHCTKQWYVSLQNCGCQLKACNVERWVMMCEMASVVAGRRE
jgi:hypothetical protein